MWDKDRPIPTNANITISRYHTKTYNIRSKTDARGQNRKVTKCETTLEQQRREIARVEVTHLENAADEREKEDCSRYSSLNVRVRSTAIVQARTSMNERPSNIRVLLH